MNKLIIPIIAVSIIALGIGAFVVLQKPAFPEPQTGSPKTNSSQVPKWHTQSDPFGIMTGRGKEVPKDLLAAIKKLGVIYFRPPNAVATKNWTGKCQECERYRNSGLKNILTVSFDKGTMQGQPGNPPRTVEDWKTYKKNFAQILDAYQPELVAIENEETSPELFYTGTSEEYQKQLEAGCEIAHKKGNKCTNGGMVSAALSLLVWNNYLSQGKYNEACDYAKRALYIIDPKRTGESFCKLTSSAQLPQQFKASLAIFKRFIIAYKNAPIDYVNFHWYSHDPRAMGESVEYLRKATDKVVISNEIGQKDYESDAEYVAPIMQEVANLGLPYAIWFCIDTGGAVSLFDKNGNLRPNGEAFLEFIKKTYR